MKIAPKFLSRYSGVPPVMNAVMRGRYEDALDYP